MSGSVDDLIQFLLDEIAISGQQGESATSSQELSFSASNESKASFCPPSFSQTQRVCVTHF